MNILLTGGAGYVGSHTAVSLAQAVTIVLHMVQAFGQANGPIPLQIDPRRTGDVAECWANPAKAKALLGWQAQLGLAEMCLSGWGFVRPQQLTVEKLVK